MKKRARKIQVWLACVFAVILLWNLGQVEAKASTAQEDNLVIIYVAMHKARQKWRAMDC